MDEEGLFGSSQYLEFSPFDIDLYNARGQFMLFNQAINRPARNSNVFLF
jgi:hypothetical protein